MIASLATVASFVEDNRTDPLGADRTTTRMTGVAEDYALAGRSLNRMTAGQKLFNYVLHGSILTNG